MTLGSPLGLRRSQWMVWQSQHTLLFRSGSSLSTSCFLAIQLALTSQTWAMAKTLALILLSMRSLADQTETPTVPVLSADPWANVRRVLELQPFIRDVALVVGDGNGRLFHQTKGDMTLDRELWVASSSKMVFVVRAMQEVEKGTIRLDDPVNKYLDYITGRQTAMTPDPEWPCSTCSAFNLATLLVSANWTLAGWSLGPTSALVSSGCTTSFL